MSDQQTDRPEPDVPTPPPRQPDENLKGYIERGNDRLPSSDRDGDSDAPTVPSR